MTEQEQSNDDREYFVWHGFMYAVLDEYEICIMIAENPKQIRFIDGKYCICVGKVE